MTCALQPQVLVIDDSADVRTFLACWLTSLGCAVRTAESGEAAQREVAQQVPDVIFLDVVLPGLNGFEICARLKRHALTRDIPVVMISGLCHPANARRAREVGAAHYLLKPIDEDALLSVISAVLNSAEGGHLWLPSVTRNRPAFLINDRRAAGDSD